MDSFNGTFSSIVHVLSDEEEQMNGTYTGDLTQIVKIKMRIIILLFL